MAIVRPTKAYLQKTSLFLCYRIAAHRNLIKKLFFSTNEKENTISLFYPSTELKKKEDNIKTMIDFIHKYHMRSSSVTTDRGLVNVFIDLEATSEIKKDLLTFRKVGLEYFKLYVQYHNILKTVTTKAPVRKHKLLTMAQKSKESDLSTKNSPR